MSTRKKAGSVKVITTSLNTKSKMAAIARASYILPAPKGPRTLTHQQIKRGVQKAFEERYGKDA